jgi:uncharacterized protein (TIGR01777 family)
MKVVLAGGSGSLGRRVADHMTRAGADVVVLTRRTRTDLSYRQVAWDGRSVGPWADELDGSVLLNLAGELVDRRPTPDNIALLERSRVEPTSALAQAAAAGMRPSLWLQMSTLAIYGDAGETVIEDGQPAADGPPQMAGVAKAWERAVENVSADRLVVLRTGIVLDRHTPALDRLTGLARWGLGGRIGGGDQWISWIHIDDFLRALDHLMAAVTITGPVHLTSPNPIRNRDMMSALRHAMHRPWSPPMPKVFVHLGAALMRTDPALALTGRRCIPTRLVETGFEFEHPDFAGALVDLTDNAATPARAS